MVTTIPIFIISYNRGYYLNRVIASYQRQNLPVEIIVHDFGSYDPETLSILSDLETSGMKVVRSARIRRGTQLDLVDHTIQDYWRDRPPSRYVVTDCDIDLSIASPDGLAIYNELLDRFGQAECVGPMIRITDVPKAYPLYNRVMNRHIQQFWHREPQWLDSRNGARVAYLPADIDTTFALHRENSTFRRLKHGIRVYFPYEAQHLDWYQSREDLRNSEYYQSSFEGIGNWSNKVAHGRFAAEQLEYEKFVYVDSGPDGTIRAQTMLLKDDFRVS